MKAPPLRYCRPDTLNQALELLAQYGDDARLLAGGQSLMPSLALRLSSPAVLIDMARVPDLRGIDAAGGGLRIGAMTTHQDVERSALVARQAPLLSIAMPLVAHPPIRARGTFGGSVALADPAAEAPAATLAHAAVLIAQSRQGQRRIAADDFFQGLFLTALKPDEILLAAEFPPPQVGERFVFRELARRSGDFATVGIAARARFDGDRVAGARLVLFGVGDRAITVPGTAAVLAGRPLDAATVDAAVEMVRREVEPFADLNHDQETKRHLLGVLMRRVLVELSKGKGHA